MNTQPLTDLKPRIETAITVTQIYLKRQNTKLDKSYLERMLNLLTDELNALPNTAELTPIQLTLQPTETPIQSKPLPWETPEYLEKHKNDYGNK
jgi:hypothetical protein